MEYSNISKFVVGLIFLSMFFSNKDNRINSMEDYECGLIDQYLYEQNHTGRDKMIYSFLSEEEPVEPNENESNRNSLIEMDTILAETLELYSDNKMNVDPGQNTVNEMIEEYMQGQNFGENKDFISEVEEEIAQKKDSFIEQTEIIQNKKEKALDDSFIKQTEIIQNKKGKVLDNSLIAQIEIIQNEIDKILRTLNIKDNQKMMDLLNVTYVMVAGYCNHNIKDLNDENIYQKLKWNMTIVDTKKTNQKYIYTPAYYLTEQSYNEIKEDVKTFLKELSHKIDMEEFCWQVHDQIVQKLGKFMYIRKKNDPFWYPKLTGNYKEIPTLLYDEMKKIIKMKKLNNTYDTNTIMVIRREINDLIKKKLTNGKTEWNMSFVPRKGYKCIVPLNLNDFKSQTSQTHKKTSFLYGIIYLTKELNVDYLNEKLKIYYINPSNKLLLARIYSNGKPPKDLSGRVYEVTLDDNLDCGDI